MCPIDLDATPLTAGSPAPPDWFAGRSRHWWVKSPEAAARGYVVSERTRRVVNTALMLGEPLLVTGEPGTGKTQLAYWIASSLGLLGDPGEAAGLHRFQVQSTSNASDLMYRFDAVKYLRGAQTSDEVAPADCVEPGVLQRALVDAREHRRPSVVLIDEIDKAPRDFPNDLLRPLEELEWRVDETDEEIGFRTWNLPADLWPIFVITSNLERKLPEPFLRRCMHLHLELTEDLLRDILVHRVPRSASIPGLLDRAIGWVMWARQRATRRPPGTSEALVWLSAVLLTGEELEPPPSPDTPLDADIVERRADLAALFKDPRDLGL